MSSHCLTAQRLTLHGNSRALMRWLSDGPGRKPFPGHRPPGFIFFQFFSSAVFHAHTTNMLQQRRSFTSSTSDRRGRQQPQASRPRSPSVWEAVFLVGLLIVTCINLYTYSDRRERVRGTRTTSSLYLPPMSYR